MTAAEIIRLENLCGDLARFAVTLDIVRDRVTASDPSVIQPRGAECVLWSRSAPDPAGRARGLSADALPWYHEIEADYGELEGLLCKLPTSVHDRLFACPAMLAHLPALYCLRAAYEFDKEMMLARAIRDASDSAHRLARLVGNETYWTLVPALEHALQNRKNVLVVGSGPLPLTALSIATSLKVPVTCVERDPEAAMIARDLVELSEHRDLIDDIRADILDVGDLDKFDTIICAVLMGVETRLGLGDRKPEIVEHLLTKIAPGATLILRDPAGLGRLLYPAAKLGGFRGVDITRWIPDASPDRPYCSGLIFIRRSGTGDAHAS